MVTTEAFQSAADLAAFSEGKTAVVLVVGSRESCEPVFKELGTLVKETEYVVHVEPNSKIFESMESPAVLPGVGIWSSKGSLVGYREDDETLAEFVEYARRYC